MTNIILSLISEIIVTFLNIVFVSCFASCKRRTKVDYACVVIAQVILAVESELLNAYPLIRIIINVSIFIFMMRRLFVLTLKKGIITVTTYTAIYGTVEVVVYLGLQRFISVPLFDDITQTDGAFLIDILTDMIMLMLIIGLNAVLKKSNLSRMDMKGWVIYTLYPLFSIVVLCFLVTSFDRYTSVKQINIYLFICGGLFVLNLLLFYLLNNVITRELEMAKDRELVENAEHIYEMYETLSEEREIQKAQAHDYRNNLNAIHSLALKGDTDTLQKYIEEQLENVDKTHDIYDTGNSIVNAVLNRKYHEAEAKGILFPIVCDNLASVGISNSDLVTILSNILDNAIEAVQTCEEKKITLKIKVKDGTLYIVSTNTYLEVKEGLKTTKQDADNHGYGLNNIRKAAADNGGECYVECEEGEFRITVLIPYNKS